jgi:hypothetical protein
MPERNFVELYVGIGVHQITTNKKHPRHWCLLLAPSGSQTCTYHSVDVSIEMDQPITYERVIIRDFDINDPRIESKEQITTIPAGLKDVLKRTIASFKPQRCQDYVLAILEALSKSGQVPCSGILDYFKELTEPSLYEKTKKNHFVGIPCLI